MSETSSDWQRTTIDSAQAAAHPETAQAVARIKALRQTIYQIERLHRIAIDAGLDPEIAEMYREFVVTEAKKRHQRIADAGGDPGVLDVFA